MGKLGGIEVRNTSNIINEHTKICMILWAPFKFGKTTTASTLDKMTKRFFGKPSLVIGCEAADGGGTMSLEDREVDYVMPTNREELTQVVTALAADRTYGGVILDSATEMVKRFLQPFALKFPSREKQATRIAGVPERSDYQTMGEDCRVVFNNLVRLTTLQDLDARKHLVITALDLDKKSDTGTILSVGPNLPGAMATTAGGIVQTVAEIKIKPTVVDGKRVSERIMVTQGDGIRMVGDRTHIFPAEGKPDFEYLWEQYWVPAIEKRKVVA